MSILLLFVKSVQKAKRATYHWNPTSLVKLLEENVRSRLLMTFINQNIHVWILFWHGFLQLMDGRRPVMIMSSCDIRPSLSIDGDLWSGAVKSGSSD